MSVPLKAQRLHPLGPSGSKRKGVSAEHLQQREDAPRLPSSNVTGAGKSRARTCSAVTHAGTIKKKEKSYLWCPGSHGFLPVLIMEVAANLNNEQRHSRVWFLRSGRSSLAERGRRTGSGRQRRHTVGEGPGAGAGGREGGGGGRFNRVRGGNS